MVLGLLNMILGIDEAPECKGGEPCVLDEPGCCFYRGGFCTYGLSEEQLPSYLRLDRREGQALITERE